MPQLFSRMDDMNWLTPSIADIFDQGPAPPGGDGSIREQIMWLQEKLTEKETPTRVINVRPTPSYTLFIVRAEPMGRRGNRKQTTQNDIKRSLGQIAEERKDWKFGFIPQLNDVPDAMGILLRTDEHKSLSLRRLLVRTTFRDHASTLAFAVGNTLEQRLIVEDLDTIGNLLIAGTDSGKQHFMYSLLLTLITLNTPSELRMVITGQSAEELRVLTSTPHTLGRLLYSPQEARPLIGGLIKELERRQGWLLDENVDSIAAYNLILRDKGQTRIPRLILVVDSISDERWKANRELWADGLEKLLRDGGKSGIHLIITANQPIEPDLPEAIAAQLPCRFVTRSAATNAIEDLDNFHGSLMRFIDAAYFDREGHVFPVELCTITNEEVQKAVDYWQQNMHQRNKEVQTARVSGRTGVTQVLNAPVNIATQEDQQLLDIDDEPAPLGETLTTEPQVEAQTVTLQQAQALAAYLGWIGIGPLQDILGMTPEAAMKTITVLKAMGIVEDNNSHTPRFVRAIGLNPANEK